MKTSLIRCARTASSAAPRRKVTDFKKHMPQSSYYKNNLPGESLQRARQQYIIPNAILGSGIFVFAIGIYIFTLRAVSQDEFEDVPVPDAPAPSPNAPHASPNKSAGSTSVGT